MLCYPLTERKISRLSRDYFLGQAKLNGERAWVRWYGGYPYLVSSYGLEIKYVPHINKAILEQVEPGTELDGELYQHGMRLEDIHSIVSRKVNKHVNSEEIQYHIFDLKNEKTQAERLLQIEKMNLKGPLFSVKTFAVKGNMDHLSTAMISLVNDGYEGLIIRDLYAPYTEARSPFVLKWKPTQEDDYLIVGVQEGEGWAQGMLGAFVVQGDDGTQFKVGTGALLTKEKRRLLWNKRDILLGKMLTVRHEFMKTRHGIPRCATAHSMKDDLYEGTTIATLVKDLDLNLSDRLKKEIGK